VAAAQPLLNLPRLRPSGLVGWLDVNAQEDDTPSGLPPHDPERDVLAQRRALRGEPVGDPILIRRAETAEAAAHALEERLAGIQARLQEAEYASRDTSQRLAEREQELTRASQRLGEGELQLRTISARLADRESELHAVSERLSDRERDLSAVSERLAQREQQLQRAELEIRGRVDALERRVEEVHEDLARERVARLAAERELEALKAAQAAVQPLVGDLRQIAGRLRVVAEAGARTDQAGVPSAPGPLAQAEQPAPLDEQADIVAPPATVVPSAQAEASSEQMAEALAAAIQRLRARVAAVGELQEGEAESGQPVAEPSAPSLAEGATTEQAAPVGTPYAPPPLIERAPPRAWLAPAIRRVAERRDPRLAAELVLELLPAQALSVERPIRYLAKIAELGAYEVSLTAGDGSVRDLAGVGLVDAHTFLLEGPAAAFAEVAAGGSRISAWRPPAGLRIRGGRRRARPLLGSRRAPLALGDLERAGVTVWPGLLLLALAEAIDPASTAGHSFTVAFAIEGQQNAVLQAQALQGRPLTVTRGPANEQAQGAPNVAATTAQSTVHLSERAFARLLTAQDLDGHAVRLEGERAPLETLLSWTDRVQGIRRFGA
jgi:hypothetical protein